MHEVNVVGMTEGSVPPAAEANGAPTGIPADEAATPSRAGNFAASRTFPRRTLEQALRIPRALKEKNAGNPWEPKEVAAVIGVGRTSGNFYYLTASSRDYGLTIGTRDSGTIELTDLGREAVYPASGAGEKKVLLAAFLMVDSFRKTLEYYKGNNLPEQRYLANVLQQTIGIDPDYHEEFVDIFQKNCRFVGIGSEYRPGEDIKPSITEGVRAAGRGSVVLAEPPGTSDGARVCFIVMPFIERDDRHLSGFFEEVLANLFRPAVTAAGFEARTAQRQGSDVIQATIVNDLLEADLVLADLTEHNPNVLFELGMRMHADKPVALVRAKGTGPIFDVDNMLRVEEYDPSLWTSAVEKDVPRLTAHILGAWENRATAQTFMRLLRRQD
jgi:hypothetical protein